MERDFNNDEFEFFLKQKADQYKIYPSEKSWRNIYNTLHSRWKWFTFGGSLILLTGLFFFSNDFIFSNSSKSNHPSTAISPRIPDTKQTINQPGNPFISSKPDLPRISPATQPVPTPLISSLAFIKIQERRIKDRIVTQNLVKSSPADKPVAKTSLHLRKVNLFSGAEGSGLNRIIDIDVPVKQQLVKDEVDLISKVEMHLAPLIETEAALSGEINWMEEMAAIKLNAQKKNPFHLQFYFSPSVSYRRLADNKTTYNVNQQNIPLATGNKNIDRYVDHKPSIGAELGSNILFSAGRNLTFKTGLQLNYSRYTIKAYKFYFEKASIALNTLGPIADTITSYTSFRNFSGYSPEELQNQYLQLSVPIGAELKLLGNKRLQLNIAGTIQPTYLLLNDTYLLSTDYVNYAKEPSLVRKWNVHTSMEAFVSYKTGGVRWQVGPQFRYQLMSSYNDRYPIKEYLIEYGFKVGVSKTLR